MARTPEQSETGLTRDRSDLFRILERARKNTDRPREMNERLVKLLAEANVILMTEPSKVNRSMNGKRQATR